jgi:hypothetical protein
MDEVDELYSVPLGGGAVTKLNGLLVASGDVFAFRIGPGSQRVVYVADQDATGGDELYSVPLGGGTVTKLNGPLAAGGDVIANFFISPNDGLVLYRADQDTNNVLELYTDILQAELKALFESPLANAVVAGIALIRGWAFDTVAGEAIASVQLFIDGLLDADATCCAERSDVRAAFPAFPAPNTLNSGWGLTKNWGNEASGPIRCG